MNVKLHSCFLLALIASVSSVASAQDQRSRTVRTGQLPAPVRGVSWEQSVDDRQQIDRQQVHDSAADHGHQQAFFGAHASPINGLRGSQMHSHQVIRAPGTSSTPMRGIHAHAQRAKSAHPPHSKYKRRFQPQPPILPEANQESSWKNPYSYGYFGASGKRHWSQHYGYRDRYTEWRLR